jgi:hypothetical protein
MKTRYSLLFGIFALAACEKTPECSALESMLEHNQKLLKSARSKAAVHDRLAKAAADTEKSVTTYLDEIGLNWNEAKLNKALDHRMKKVPGSRVIRQSRSKMESSTQNLLRRAKTFWSVEYAAENMDKGVLTAMMFTGDKPLFMFERLSFDTKSNRWLLELGRAVIDEVPNKPLPNALQPLKDYSTVDSKFGFCGANKLRSELEDIKIEYKNIKDKAEAISVFLPKQATWKGLQRRAKILVTVEAETRKIIQRLLKGVADLKLRIRGLAFEEPFVMAEITGGEKQAKRLMRYMGAMATSAQLMKAEKGRIRILVPNPAIRSFQNKGGGGGGLTGQSPGPGPGAPRKTQKKK